MSVSATDGLFDVQLHQCGMLRECLGAAPLGSDEDAWEMELFKDWGETKVADQGLLTTPAWDWGQR